MKHKYLLLILILGFILRVMYLGKFPIGFYSDEAAFGYNAYLLLKTGHDEYGRFWPVSFESFGDWKPPLQAWLAIPSIFIFGLNEFAVRLPSAILGTATIAVIYFLSLELFSNNQRRKFSEHSENSDSRNVRLSDSQKVGLSGVPSFPSFPIIASFLLAINPWHIFMSRIAMLVSVEVFFISLGVLGLIRCLHDTLIPAKAGIYRNILYRFRVKHEMTSWWWIASAISFVGATYSYYGSRVTVPLILLIFTLVYFNELKSRLKELLVPIAVGTILLLPLVFSAFKNPLFLTGRSKTTSVFFNDNVRLQLWDAHTKAGLKKIPPLISRIFDNKPYYYTKDILERYWSHFSPAFLFFKGDSHPPFKIPRLGYLHLIDLPFFLIGLWLIRRKAEKDQPARFLILYLLLSPLVASFTFLTPAANRSFNLVIPWTLITAFGVSRLMAVIPANLMSFPPSLAVRPAQRVSRSAFWRASKPGMTIVIAFLYFVSLSLFFHSYVYLIPQELPHYWHYGRKELVNKLQPLLGQYQKIYLTNKGGPPYIFLSFYLPIEPQEFQSTIRRNPIINELGWGHVDNILNVIIPREFNWQKVPRDKNALYIGFENEINELDVDILDRVYYPSGETAYVIARL